MSKRTDELVQALKDWIAEKYGRQTEAAKILGVSSQTVNDWCSTPPRKQLTGEQALDLQAFLKNKRRKKQ